MNYQKHYNLLIEKAQNRTILPTEYKENHHIIPRCLGGSDDKTNLVALMADEHFIAHLLLAKIHKNHLGLVSAAVGMMYGWGHSKQKRKICKNNKSFKRLKERYAELKSIAEKGTKKIGRFQKKS